jgi:hypothetical protein
LKAGNFFVVYCGGGVGVWEGRAPINRDRGTVNFGWDGRAGGAVPV